MDDVFFLFFKQKTSYEMRIRDWSSDVCSSDLLLRGALALHQHRPYQHAARKAVGEAVQDVADDGAGRRGHHADDLRQEGQRPLARGIEEALSREFFPAVLQQLQQRALTGQLQRIGDDLVLGAARSEAQTSELQP